MSEPSKSFGRGLIVGGVATSAPTGVPVRTFIDSDKIVRFPAVRKRSQVTELVIHETVSRSVQSTVDTLIRRGLGVHLILGPNGELTQHADLATDVLSHASGHNSSSFGVEVVNPYDPELLRKGLPWDRVIEAPWAWKGKYVLPTLAQAEAVAELVRWATSARAPSILIPRRWPGLKGGSFQLGLVKEAKGPLPGILAHQYFGHSDGAWLVLYAWLRIEVGLAPAAAYDEAARRATGASSAASVQDLIPTAVV